jgi:hypothetical protein
MIASDSEPLRPEWERDCRVYAVSLAGNPTSR